MSRRSGQNGYIEQRGKAFYIRFRIDVAGQQKRDYACIRICPVSGPGKMTASERKRRAKEIIAESGANSEQHFRAVEAINLGVTFREQAKWWLEHMQTRKRKPVKPATIKSWSHCLSSRINPQIGDVPIADVNNSTVKDFVSKLADEGLSANTIRIYVQTVKMVVASAVDKHGEQLYPRKWNHDFIDLPEIKNQRTPSYTAEQITQIVASAAGWHRVLYALLAGTGLRIGEALGLEIGKHISADGLMLSIRQSVWNGSVQNPKTENAYREVDLDPLLATLLKQHIGQRTSGFLFPSYGGRPIASQSCILKRHLHPTLKAVGCERAGFHSFRRYRVTHLRKNRVPEDLIRFWVGHADKSVTDSYSQVKQDVAFRQLCAANVGLGFTLPIEKPSEKLKCTNMHEGEAMTVAA